MTARKTPVKLTIEQAVREYLKIVAEPPEPEPKRVRDRDRNDHERIAFNRAQELLRSILEETGHKRLAKTRAKGQIQPTIMGNTRIWIG